MTENKDAVRRQAMGAVLQRAILSWQVAVTVAFTLLLFALGPEPFAFWQDWFWLVAGGLAAGAFVVSTLTDEDAVEEAISRQFEKQYDVSSIRNSTARRKVQDALEYRRSMTQLAKGAKGALRANLLQTVHDVDDWIEHMVSLAHHIDSFEANRLVERDRQQVPQQLERTKRRMEREESPEVRRELERQVEQLEQQLTNLQATEDNVRRAEIQLETTLSSLATVYAQMARLGAKEVDSGRAQRLRLEIKDEISGLQDTIEAMDEVQAQYPSQERQAYSSG